MENIKTDIESLIVGFFTNSLSENDMEKLSRWLDEDVSHREEFDRLRSAWIMAGYETGKKRFDPWTGWLSIKQRIKGERIWRSIRWVPWRYAASLLICFALGSTLTIYMPRSKQASETFATGTTISAPLGAKSNIILPDGSSVWLNAGSEIYYSSDFGLKSRDLQLTGEAFFDVKSDSLKPFNVHTSGMTVKALGTRFNVKAYPEDPTMVATLEEGIIDVVLRTSSGRKTDTQSVKLKPKEQLVIHKTVKPVVTATPPSEKNRKVASSQPTEMQPEIAEFVINPDVKTELSTSWKDNKWIISEETLANFVENLERRYNVCIHFASEELKEYSFSGIIENETIEQILTALSLSAPVNYMFDKNHIVLSINMIDRDKFNKVLKIKK